MLAHESVSECGEPFIPVRRDQNYCRLWCREHKYLTRLEGEAH